METIDSLEGINEDEVSRCKEAGLKTVGVLWARVQEQGIEQVAQEVAISRERLLILLAPRGLYELRSADHERQVGIGNNDDLWRHIEEGSVEYLSTRLGLDVEELLLKLVVQGAHEVEQACHERVRTLWGRVEQDGLEQAAQAVNLSTDRILSILAADGLCKIRRWGFDSADALWAKVGEHGIEQLATEKDVPYDTLVDLLAVLGQDEIRRASRQANAGFDTPDSFWQSVSENGIEHVAKKLNITSRRISSILLAQGWQEIGRGSAPYGRPAAFVEALRERVKGEQASQIEGALWKEVKKNGIEEVAETMGLSADGLLSVLAVQGLRHITSIKHVDIKDATDLWARVGERGLKTVAAEVGMTPDRLKNVLTAQGLREIRGADLPWWRQGSKALGRNWLEIVVVVFGVFVAYLFVRTMLFERVVVVSKTQLVTNHLITEDDVRTERRLGAPIQAFSGAEAVIGRYTLQEIAPNTILEVEHLGPQLSEDCKRIVAQNWHVSVSIADSTLLRQAMLGRKATFLVNDSTATLRVHDGCVLKQNGGTSVLVAVSDSIVFKRIAHAEVKIVRTPSGLP